VQRAGSRPDLASPDASTPLTSDSFESGRPREGRSRRRGRGKLTNAPIAVDTLLDPERFGSSTLIGRPVATARLGAPPPGGAAGEGPAQALAGLSLEEGSEQE
jgi:hypothetical protein